jgi:uncharacterized delta-60 repeat protein
MRAFASIVASLFFAVFCTSVVAAPGDPDPTFGAAGVQFLDFGTTSTVTIVGSALQPDGRIVVAGHSQSPSGRHRVAIGRLDSNGSVDMTFGTSGWTVVDRSSSGDDLVPIGVVVQSDGSIVVAGQANQTYTFFIGLTASGGLQPFFGPDGVRFDYDSFAEYPRAVALTPSSGLIVAGYYNDIQARDTSFTVYDGLAFRRTDVGVNGRVRFAAGAGNDEAGAIAVTSDGSFYLAGYADDATGNRDFAVSRIRSDFTLDPAFCSGGVKTIDLGGRDEALTITPTQFGAHLLVAGRSAINGTYSRAAFAVIRLGICDLDPGINNGEGKVVTPVIYGNAPGYASAVDAKESFASGLPDGYTLFVNVRPDQGGNFPDPNSDIVIAKYDRFGAPSATFGNGGQSRVPGGPDDGDFAVSGYLVNESPVAIGTRYFFGESLVAARMDASGSPDPSFGAGGVAQVFVYYPANDNIASIARLGDGAFAGVSWSELQRYSLFRIHADGSWDSAFNGVGTVDLVPATYHVAGQADGKVVAVAELPDPFNPQGPPRTTVKRWGLDGQPDPAFSNTATIEFGGTATSEAIVVMPGGQIIVAATVSLMQGGRIGVARFNADGNVDFSFGNFGKTIVDSFDGVARSARALAAMADGGFVVSGIGDDGRVAAFRLTPSGFVDMSWGSSGLASAPCSVNEHGGVAVGPDGSVVIGGHSAPLVSSCFARFLANGLPDLSFGSQGVAIHSITNNFDSVTGLAVEPDGRILGSISTANAVSLVRLNVDGSLDGSFNLNGYVSVSPGTGGANGVILQPDAKVVAWGTRQFQGSNDVMIARFESGSVSAPPPDTLITAFPGNGPSATFEFVATDPPATFECSIDSVPFFACASPITFSLADGPHHFEVRALVGASVDPTPATYDWTLSSAPPPETSITAFPDAHPDATFQFMASDPSATFECRLDAGTFTACTSPITYSGLAETAHHFEVRARLGFAVDPTPATYDWAVDVTPPETFLTSAPGGSVASTSATFEFSSSEPGAFIVCSLDGAQFTGPCASPLTYTGLGQGPHTFRVTSFDSNGNTDPTPATASWVVDTAAPETTITSAPSGSISSADATIAFTANEPSTFECRLDGAAFAPCASPAAYTGLAEGTHAFEVRATDGVGNVDATPASATWTIDRTPPETTITSHPSDATSAQSAAFTFTSNDSTAGFRCQLDTQPLAACASPATYDALAEGAHTFAVAAVDTTGNVDATPAIFSWIVDHTSPDTLVTSGPAAYTASTSATLTFQSNESGSTFECALDAAAFSACASPVAYSGLAEGAHQFRVRAIDAAQNADTSPSAFDWTIDLTSPDTTIASAPPLATAQASATFAFSSNEAGAIFECRLDGSSFAACASPTAYAGLTEGFHTFEVRAADAAGNLDAQPASWTWKVDLTPPDTTITSGPSGNNNASSATFAFTSNEAGATFQCQLDGSAFVACASGVTYSGLARGDHTFRVRAVDAAGNTDSTPAVRTWKVNH